MVMISPCHGEDVGSIPTIGLWVSGNPLDYGDIAVIIELS